MELANCTLALGGNIGQTIQKFAVTPSEVAILRYLHGDDAVSNIEVYATVDRSSNVERGRLTSAYGRFEDGALKCRAVDALFPGIAARMFQTFDELPDPAGMDDPEIPLVETVTPVAETIVPLEARKVTGRPKKAKPEAAAPAPEDANELLS